MNSDNRTYIAIDLKSFYASVECVARGLDPLKARLLVADETRSDNTIVPAVSPARKRRYAWLCRRRLRHTASAAGRVCSR